MHLLLKELQKLYHDCIVEMLRHAALPLESFERLDEQKKICGRRRWKAGDWWRGGRRRLWSKKWKDSWRPQPKPCFTWETLEHHASMMGCHRHLCHHVPSSNLCKLSRRDVFPDQLWCIPPQPALTSLSQTLAWPSAASWELLNTEDKIIKFTKDAPVCSKTSCGF